MTKEDFIKIIDSNNKELIKKYINDPQFIAFIKHRIYVYDGYDYQSKVDSDVIVYGDTKGCTVSLLASDVEVDTQYYREKKLNEILG